MRKRYRVFICSILVFVICANIGVQFLIPEKVNLMVGKEEEISFNLPLKISMKQEEKIVVSGMDTLPVTDNIEIDLSKKTTVTPVSEGVTQAEISAFGIPLKTVAVNIIPNKTVIPCGKVVGVVMKTEGILVLGTGGVKNGEGETEKPAEGLLRTGDVIVKCNMDVVEEKEDLKKAVEDADGKQISLTVKRDGKESVVNVVPTKNEDGEYKIGIWIRDSTQGLGTVTFIDTENHTYAALGHGVYDVDTKSLTPVSEGVLTEAEVFGIEKGASGTPGEITGRLSKSSKMGDILGNTDSGIFGSINSVGEKELGGEAVEIALMQDVHEGDAVIKSDVLGGDVEEYAIKIESINRLGRSTDKGMVIRITDKRLLDETGGIIQGMSGSPIIQDGKLIGAVTHVFVKDPAKGYGIFIENMLKTENATA